MIWDDLQCEKSSVNEVLMVNNTIPYSWDGDLWNTYEMFDEHFLYTDALLHCCLSSMECDWAHGIDAASWLHAKRQHVTRVQPQETA